MSKKLSELQGAPALFVVLFVAIISGVGALYITNISSNSSDILPTQASLPIATTNVETPRPILSPLADRLTSVEGIQSVPVLNIQSLDDGGTQTLIEVITSEGYNTEDTANRVFAYVLEEIMTFDQPAPLYFSLVIDDGIQKTIYEIDGDGGSFDIRLLIPPTPIIITAIPQSIQKEPGNCSTAVAMGLSAEQAAQYPNLDRDKDGVACYGD